MKIKKGDKVTVLVGKDAGKSGVVERAFPKEDRVIVSGIHMAKIHEKGRGGKKGTVVEKAMPIHVSNVKIAKSK